MELYHSKADGRQEESQMLDRVEAILKQLTKKERKTINQFFDLNTERHAKETTYFYACGFKDGIRTMKFINRL